MLNFAENLKYIKDEYIDGEFDESTGLSPKEIEDYIAAYIEGNPDMPLETLNANTLAYTLDNVRIFLNEHTIFPDKMDVGITYTPWAELSLYGRVHRRKIGQRFKKAAPETFKRKAVAVKAGISNPGTDFWHTVPDWEQVISLGISGLLARAEEYKKSLLESHDADNKKLLFYDSVVIAYSSVVRYMNRLADYGEKKGLSEYANTMRQLTKRAPDSFYEVMLLSLLFLNIGELGVEHYRTLGRIDCLYYPYYKKDIESGNITKEGAGEMLRFFFTKINAALREAAQPICIGGTDENGNDTTNELTRLILEIYRELGIFNPKIHIRCNKNSPKEIKRTALSMIRDGVSSMVLLNDEAVVKAYSRIGVDEKLANTYTPIGCYEPVIIPVEDARICAAWLNLAAPVAMAVKGEYTTVHESLCLPRTIKEPRTFDMFFSEYLRLLGGCIDYTMGSISEQLDVQHLVQTSPILSGSFECCMKSGRDAANGGMELRNASVKCFAIGTAVDSLLAVKKVVYDEKIMSLPELAEVLENNWEGNETLRRLIRNDKNKWANNYELPNKIGREIYEFCASRIIGRKTGVGGVFRMGADSVAMSERFAPYTPATPDGRRDGEPMTKNLRAENGMEREGVTAFINSVCALDGSLFLDAAPLDFVVHPTAVEGEKGIAVMEAMLDTFFEGGGFAFQGNVVSAETLKAAQADPEKYSDLQIRVCGWNELFVNMDKFLQDDIIARAEGIER